MTSRLFKWLLILLLYFIINEPSKAQNKTDNNGKKQGDWVFIGEYDSILKLSNPKIKCVFINDTVQGYYEVYDKNDVLRYESQVVGGKKTGIARTYDKNQRLVWLTNFFDDTLRSVVIFSKKGVLVRIIEFNGKVEHGIEQNFWSKGRPWRRHEFSNGILLKKNTYFKNGRKASELLFEENGLMLSATYFNRWGKIKSTWKKE